MTPKAMPNEGSTANPITKKLTAKTAIHVIPRARHGASNTRVVLVMVLPQRRGKNNGVLLFFHGWYLRSCTSLPGLTDRNGNGFFSFWYSPAAPGCYRTEGEFPKSSVSDVCGPERHAPFRYVLVLRTSIQFSEKWDKPAVE
jgi:hypothetical protein